MSMFTPDHLSGANRPSSSRDLRQFTPAELTPYQQTFDGSRREEYGWLGQTDLTKDMIKETDRSYTKAAGSYSTKEWSPESIRTVWEHIFSHPVLARVIPRLNRRSLDDQPHILLGGAGTMRDTLLMALLHPRAQVLAYDVSPEMLAEGQGKINWQYMVSLSHEIAQMNPEVNGFVGELNSMVKMLNEASEKIATISGQAGAGEKSIENFLSKIEAVKQTMFESFEEIAASTQNRITHQVTDHLNFPLDMERQINQTKMDLIMDVATLQHLPKPKLDQAIANKLELLAVGGVYHFNIRMDTVGHHGLGRTFFDTELGPKHRRYFHTMTEAELALLVDRILSGDLMSTCFGHQNSLNPAVFRVTVGANSPHPNSAKPAFRDVFVERVR